MAATNRTGVTIPPAPKRLSGSVPSDIGILHQYIMLLHQQLIVASAIVQRLDAIGTLTPLERTISDPPTKADVDAVVTLMNQIITAAKEV